MPSSTIDQNDPLNPLDDPKFIDGIFNYCTRRCEPCVFKERCRMFRDLQEQERAHPAHDVFERIRDNFQRTFNLVRSWCEREGIDFATLQADAQSEEVTEELRRMEETRNDPLQRLAEAYTHAALKLVQALDRSEPGSRWPDTVKGALETIAHLAIPISSKVIERCLDTPVETAKPRIRCKTTGMARRRSRTWPSQR